MTPAIQTGPRAARLDPRPMAYRIGLGALATDHTTEVDFARILSPRGIGVYVNRIPYANPITLAAMEPYLTDGAGLILPGEALDAVVYGCTSASVVIGDAAVRAAIHRGKPGCRL